jgi:pimeloyl-ACP methyl ester carboxylesterase
VFELDKHFRTGLRYAHGTKFEAVFYNWFDGWHRLETRNWDMRPILSKLKCPTLIVQGEADQYASPQHAKDIAEAIPRAELWLIPEAGHMLPQENANLFNPILLQFLTQPVAIEQ